MSFHDAYRRRQAEVETLLDQFLPEQGEGPPLLREAMRYSLFAGGKRIRPILCLETYRMAGGEEITHVYPLAAGLEMIHTFTLIHDDLPAMDNDDLRRGKPTNHKVYGEAMAILAGDALFSYAIQTMLKAPLPAPRLVGIVEMILDKVGLDGVIGGQVLDLQGEEDPHPTLDKVRAIHLRKTAALIEASILAGGWAATEQPDVLEDLERLGRHLGLAFQMVDDYLDEVATPEQLGKSTHKDREKGKLTYPRVRGIEGTLEDARREVDAALHILKRRFPDQSAFFLNLARYIVERVQ